jgi:integrase
MDHVTDKLLDTNRQYLKEIGHESVDYLIFSVVQEPTPMPETSFSKRFKNNTYTATCYLFPEINSEGINPHAMRHLSATLYLRDNPKDYIAVSTMLMDTLETVIRVYAKIDNRKNSESIHTWMVDKLAGRGV